MSSIASNAEDLILNADGGSSTVKIKINGTEKASISSAGAFTSTTIDATALTGNLPAISGASLTGLPADATKLPLAGGTMTGHTSHGDSVASYYGASNDLQIRHTGSHSYIQDAGDGDLIIKSNGTDVKIIGDNDEDIAKFTWNDGVDLFFNNSKKFETTSAGLEVWGKIEINSGFEFTAENGSTRMSIAHNTGNVWIDGNCSAASFTDRTPYPETLQLAYDVINSHKKLPDGQYKADDHSKQLDHSQLHEYVKAEDNNRNMSGVISCLVEVIKDLSTKNTALEARITTLEG